MAKESKIDYHSYLVDVSSSTSPRKINEIPSGVGACLKDSFVAMPPEDENAYAMFRRPTEMVGVEIGSLIRAKGGRKLDLAGAESRYGHAIEISGFRGRVEKNMSADYFSTQRSDSRQLLRVLAMR